MSHSGVEVNNSIVIQPFAAVWINVVNSIGLDWFAWSSGWRALRITFLYPRFSGAIEAVVALENAPYAAEANLNPQSIVYVVPDCFSAAL